MTDKDLDFLTLLKNANESERDWLIMEMSLQSLSDALRQAVWAAAIPHWFDHEFLNAILGFQLKDSDFKTLKELSFVEVFPERGFNVHERSRNLLLNYLWKNHKTRFQKLSKQAAAYCKKQDQDVTHWRVETLYHGLLANNLTAKDDFIKQAIDWHDSFQRDKLENLTCIILEAVSSGKLTGDIASYTYDFQAVLDTLYSRHDSAKKHLELALKQNIQNENLKADCFFDLARTHLYISDCIQARDCCQRALKNYQKFKGGFLGQANSIQLFGQIHMFLVEYNQAKDCFQQSLTIYKRLKDSLGEANCIYFLGNVHRNLAEYEEAKNCYLEASQIYQEIKNRLGATSCIHGLGLIHSARMQTTFVVTTLQQAAQLYGEIGDKYSKASCFDDLARFYQQQKQFEQALSAFNQAIEIFPNEVAWYQNRASLYMEMDDYEKAEADIKQAEIIGRNPAFTLLRKAEFSLWQQQTPQSVEFSQQAVAQRPADGNFRAFFALTLLANGQTELANSEMQQALTAIYQPHDFADLLENLDKLIRIYGERAEFTQMRELVATSRKQPNLEK